MNEPRKMWWIGLDTFIKVDEAGYIVIIQDSDVVLLNPTEAAELQMVITEALQSP